MPARRALPVLGLLALLLVPATSTAVTLTGNVEVQDQLGIEGRIGVHVDQGAVHLRASETALPPIALEAASVTAHMGWQEGHRARVDGRDVRYYTDTGNETRTFHHASLSLEPYQPVPEILTIVGPRADVDGVQHGPLSVDVVEDQVVTRVEWSERTRGTEEAPGFWYVIDGAWSRISGLEETVVQGDFQLFINNVTFTLEGDTARWETWTGYAERAPKSPLSPFETRVTVLEVRNGTLRIGPHPELDVLGERAELDLEGVVKADQATGELLDATSRYLLDETPLLLEGDGDVHLQGVSSGGRARGALEAQAVPRLRLQPHGQYEVHATEGLVATPLPSEGPAAEVPAAALWLTGALLVAGLAVLVLVRTELLGRVHQLRARARERRVKEWMRTGDRLTGVRDYEKALTWYQRVTGRYPAYAEAWYAQAVLLAELKRHGEAARAYARANEAAGGDDPELLDLAGRLAYRAGEHEQAREHWETLATVDPLRLRRSLDEVPGARDQPWVERLLSTEGEGTSRSYA